MKLGDRIALVTGGGSGIGRAIALTFAEEGARVVVNDVRAAAAKETLEAMGPRQAQGRAIQADVSDSGQVRAMFAELERELGTLDILVNNAGIAETAPGERERLGAKSEARMKELASGQGIQTHWDVTQEMPDEAWDSVISVNLRGTFLCSRAALQHMIPQRSGRIINTASGLGIRGSPGGAVYGASKAAIINFTKSLAQEVARYGITVNAIAPGVTDTPLWRGFRSDADIVEALESGRVGAPEDFVPLVIFLCSEAGGIHCGIMVDRDIYVSMGER